MRDIPEQVRTGDGWHYDDRGWITIDKPGTVFDGYRTKVNIDVTADDVTITNTTVQLSDASWGISLRHADHVRIDHNTIRGTRDAPCDNAIRDIYGDSDDITITANDLSYCSSGINHFNAGGLIRDNYIHDLGHPCAASADCGHFNGIQLGAGTGPLMTIDHNTILNPAPLTDAIMLANDDGPQRNRTITNNLLAGGGYTLYGSGSEDGSAQGIRVQGNAFSTRYFPLSGSFGPVAHWQSTPDNVWSGNYWADGPRAGQSVTP